MKKEMFVIVLLTLMLAIAFLAIGFLVPTAAPLNMPFGLFYFIADRYGWWKPGLSWVSENRWLARACFFLCPILISLAYGLAAATLAVRLGRGSTWKAKLSAVAVILTIFGLIFAVRVDPNSYVISFYGYWTSNY